MLVFLFVVPFWAEAQQIRITGRTISMPDGAPLPHVNIGIPGTRVGTVSREDGTFSLTLSRDLMDATVVFSAIGYGSERRTVRELFQSSRNEIRMTVQTMELGEVGISATRLEEERIGEHDYRRNFITAGFEDKAPGFELAMHVKARRYPSIIQYLRFYVHYNPQRSAILRVNIYEEDNGVPGRNLMTRNVIFRSTQRSGWVRLNLEPFRLVVEDDFFIALEWIENLEAPDGLFTMYFAGSRQGEARFFTRHSRHDTWLRSEYVNTQMGIVVVN